MHAEVIKKQSWPQHAWAIYLKHTKKTEDCVYSEETDPFPPLHIS